MRVLVVTNLVPDAATPQRGRWVRDQIAAIRARGIEVEEFGFPRGRSNYLPAMRGLRALLRRERFDLVHAHYGLAGWVARAAGARPLLVTFHGTDVRHPIVGALSHRLAWQADMASAVSRSLFAVEDGRPGLPPVPGSTVLPCGPDLERFAPTSRAAARATLGLDPDGRYLLFPADPARPEKRHDRAAALAAAADARLLTGGAIEPEAMSTWMNAADVVVVTSDYEGFGMAAIEALACNVPVLSTPVGVAPYLLAEIEGCLCAPFDAARWAAAAGPHLAASDPRVAGSARAATLAAGPMAERVIEVYRHLTAGAG
ncbi:MAG: glycosyltransferase [Actinobacteria bacterium]|nr:glycosyltransferase [Actinomycetota bacterium]